MHFYLKIFLVFLVNFSEKSYETPPSYCLENFNRSDCNLPPQRVFSYYKPGSRCEIETWRGCPTLNKFETEEECTNICIFIDTNDAVAMPLSGAVNEICLYNPVHVKRCSNKLSKVFVYNTIVKSCIPIIWGGCPRPKNVFLDEMSCITVCSRITENHMLKTKNNQFDLIISSLLNNISNYLEKLNNSITRSTYQYVITMKSKKKNVTENMVNVLHTTEKLVKHNIKIEKIEHKDDKEDTNCHTIEVPTIKTTIKAVKPLKATDSKMLAFESTIAPSKISVTAEVATTTAEPTLETTELETTSTTETHTTTHHTVKTTTMLRGTAKQVVLPQDL